MRVTKPFVITIEMNAKDDMEAYGMIESILADSRIKSCYIDPDVDAEAIESISDDIKRRSTIKRIK